MAAYDFECSICKKVTEIRAKMNEEKVAPICCNQEMQLKVSSSTFELKGTGWTPRGKSYLG